MAGGKNLSLVDRTDLWLLVTMRLCLYCWCSSLFTSCFVDEIYFM